MEFSSVVVLYIHFNCERNCALTYFNRRLFFNKMLRSNPYAGTVENTHSLLVFGSSLYLIFFLYVYQSKYAIDSKSHSAVKMFQNLSSDSWVYTQATNLKVSLSDDRIAGLSKFCVTLYGF